MVGGEVVETIPSVEWGKFLIWINCEEDPVGDGNNQCAVYVEDTVLTRFIEVGDTLWWQGDAGYWTPKGQTFHDKKVRRVGNSGVPRPDSEKVAV